MIKKPEMKSESRPEPKRGYKLCPECTAEVPNRTKLCPQCGHKFEGRSARGKGKREEVLGINITVFAKQMEILKAIGGHKRLAEALAEANKLDVDVFAPLGGRDQAKQLAEVLVQLKSTF
jgi:predicted amidophosphoribosyltransferase